MSHISKMNRRELAIDLKELLAFFVRKIWVVILCMVIFAIAITAYKYISDKNEMESHQASEQEITFSDTEERQIDEYVSYLNVLEGLEEYIQNSIYMQLNADTITQKNLQYYISVNDLGSVEAISAMYGNYITGGALFEDMIQTEPSLSNMYINDVIGYSNWIQGDGQLSNVIDIRIKGRNVEECEQIAASVEKQIFDFRHKLQNEGIPSHELKQVENACYEYVDTALYKRQEEIRAEVTNLKTNIDTLAATMSQAQLEESRIRRGEEVQNVTVAPIVKIQFSNVILGAIVGVLLGCIIIFCVYLFNPCVKSKKELVSFWDLRDMGNLILPETRFLNKWARNIFYKEYNLKSSEKVVVSKITRLSNLDDIEELHFVGAKKAETIKLVENCRVSVEKNIPHTYLWEDMVNDVEAIESLSSKSDVLIIVHLWNTTYKEIIQTIRFCEEQKVNVVGYVTVVG